MTTRFGSKQYYWLRDLVRNSTTDEGMTMFIVEALVYIFTQKKIYILSFIKVKKKDPWSWEQVYFTADETRIVLEQHCSQSQDTFLIFTNAGVQKNTY